MEYDEMVDKVTSKIGISMTAEDKAIVVKNLSVVNSIVKVLNEEKDSHELRSTQVIAFVIHNTLMELYASGRISLSEASQ